MVYNTLTEAVGALSALTSTGDALKADLLNLVKQVSASQSKGSNQRGQLRYLLYGKGILRCWPFQPACTNKQRNTKNFRQIVGMW